jgi:hypothetical protein
MKSMFTRFNLIVGPAGLVLLTLCLLQTPARGQGNNVYTVTFVGNLGLAPGQTLRVTQANLIELEGRKQDPVEVLGRVLLYDAQGRVIEQSAEVKIPLKEFRSFDFPRAALLLPGEQPTGRLQMRVRVEVRWTGPFPFIRDGRATGLLPASLEIIDNSTGMTTVSNLQIADLTSVVIDP